MYPPENPFSVLGVEVSASHEEITTAWKSKVKQLHPDRYPEAPEEILKKLTDEVARVNAAHDLLTNDLEKMRSIFGDSGSGEQRGDTSSNSASKSSAYSAYRKPTENACEVCGSLETDTFSFTRQIGLVIQRRVGTFDARLCKHCALAVGREYQSRTLTTGWWGAISLFANVLYIAKNTVQLLKAHKLENPVAPSGFRTMPLSPGANIAKRPLTWIGPVVIAGFLIFSALNFDSNSGTSSNYSPPPNSPTYSWSVGNCISFGTSVWPVSCGSSHQGKIIAVVRLADECPFQTESYVINNSYTYCIDKNL